MAQRLLRAKKKNVINKDFIQIDITDSGIGLPRNQLDKIFEKFYQVDQSNTRRYKGTGLGLAITKKILELHGGEIWAKSKKGEGSTFSFTLPKAR
ncbi:MAG: ATP-binding protein [bacterium]